ncbi:hypothetical protein BFAG_00303 [Bacteroides fragilis 3_1_12]|uniref:Uncharacterized protein n=1 Tax=Bacteroides fragilis 3_1_12 TaxID=457424 RepID=A0ABN0BFD0_BACFG|nr:hypothetical protein BFAG_00303 [Bacteroides fragilis 3_1_12]
MGISRLKMVYIKDSRSEKFGRLSFFDVRTMRL